MRLVSLLVALAFLGAGCGGSSASDSAASCIGAVRIDGLLFLHDDYNDARLALDQLGDRIGSVDNDYECYSGFPDGSEAGIWGSPDIKGDEVWSVPGQPQESMVAVSTDRGVRIYRSSAKSRLASALENEVIAIGVNSEFDGKTRFATIDDTDIVTELLNLASEGEPTTSTGSDGLRYFIEFEHAGGMVTVVPYFVATNQLGDRIVGSGWFVAINEALDGSADAATIGGVLLTGTAGRGEFHPTGACRTDRVDLEVAPGELLVASYDSSLRPIWWLNPPEPLDPQVVAFSQTGATLISPNFAGAMIVEVVLVDESGNAVLEGCINLGSDRKVSGAAVMAPTGIIDCRDSGDGEGTGAEYSESGVDTFDTIDAAVEQWQTDAVRSKHFGPSLLMPLISEFSTTVDLVSDSGSVQATLLLADNGDGWFVYSESLCPSE